MPKKQKSTDTLNLESILLNCREYLRSNASLNDKRDLLLTLVFLRFLGEKFENAQGEMRQTQVEVVGIRRRFPIRSLRSKIH